MGKQYLYLLVSLRTMSERFISPSQGNNGKVLSIFISESEGTIGKALSIRYSQDSKGEVISVSLKTLLDSK